MLLTLLINDRQQQLQVPDQPTVEHVYLAAADKLKLPYTFKLVLQDGSDLTGEIIDGMLLRVVDDTVSKDVEEIQQVDQQVDSLDDAIMPAIQNEQQPNITTNKLEDVTSNNDIQNPVDPIDPIDPVDPVDPIIPNPVDSIIPNPVDSIIPNPVDSIIPQQQTQKPPSPIDNSTSRQINNEMNQCQSANDFTLNIEQTVIVHNEQQTPDNTFRESFDKILKTKPDHPKPKPKLAKLKSFFQEAPARILAKTLSDNQRFSDNIANPKPKRKSKPHLLEEFEDHKKVEKRVQIMQRIEAEKQLKDEQMRRNKEGNRLILQIKEKIKQKEQVMKLKEESLILPELEKRKQVLAQKRELSQPIRLDKLTEHQRKYDDEMKMRKLEKEAQKIEFDLELKQKSHKFPKSQAQLRVEEEQRHLKIQQQLEADNKKMKRQRQYKYADVVKDIFFKDVPKQKSPPKKETLPDISLQIKTFMSGQGNLKKLEKAIGKPARHQSQDSRDSKELKSVHEAVRRPPRVKKQDVPPLPEKPKTTDYLQQMKKQRQHQPPLQEQWEKIMEDDKNPDRKYQDVLNKVQLMEQKAKERERLAVTNNDADAEDQANQLYIETIKAKLALLDN